VGAIIVLAIGGASGCDCSDDGAPPGGSTDAGPRVGVDAPGGGFDGPAPGTDTGPIVMREPVPVTDPDGSMWTCYVTICSGHETECGDCVDNDGDGLVDSHDRECLGPCDDTEGPELLAGIGGETGGPCKADCYFDFGNGSGNDTCYHDHRCDPLSIAPTFDPEGPDCQYEMSRVGTRDCPTVQTDLCYDVCRPLTPNGCDCFGCCTFPELTGRAAAEGGEYVWLGSVVEGTNDGTCTFDDVLDTTLCRPCTPVGNCFNPCETCEICIGRPTLPPECMTPPDGGVPDGWVPPMRCAPDVQPCGLPGDADCPMDYYCVTGCCQSVII